MVDIVSGDISNLARNFVERQVGRRDADTPTIPDKAFDVGALRAKIDQGGLARPTLFKVEMVVPEILRVGTGKATVTPTLELYCVGAQAPGVNLADIPVERYGYGPTDRIPHTPIFSDLILNFVCDAQGEIQRWFERWAAGIIRHGVSEPFNADGDIKPYEVQYKNKYATQVHIKQYNEGGDLTHRTRLNWAWPLSYETMQYSWAQQNSILVLPVRFTYFDRTDDLLTDKPSIGADTQLTLVQRYANRVQAASRFVEQFKQPQNVTDVLNLANRAGDAISSFRGLPRTNP